MGLLNTAVNRKDFQRSVILCERSDTAHCVKMLKKL